MTTAIPPNTETDASQVVKNLTIHAAIRSRLEEQQYEVVLDEFRRALRERLRDLGALSEPEMRAEAAHLLKEVLHR